jgi:hypothetical protein
MNLVILWGELGGFYLAGLLFCPVCLDASYTQNYCLGLAFNLAVSYLDSLGIYEFFLLLIKTAYRSHLMRHTV